MRTAIWMISFGILCIAELIGEIEGTRIVGLFYACTFVMFVIMDICEFVRIQRLAKRQLDMLDIMED